MLAITKILLSVSKFALDNTLLPFSNSTTQYTPPLQLIYYLRGPTPILSSNGYRFYISFINAFSHFTWIYLLRTKSEAYPTFLNFKAQVEL